MTVTIALVRGLARHGADGLGNFWVDLVRRSLRLLLPVVVIVALFFVAAETIQSLAGFGDVVTLAGQTQQIPGGPAASQEAIKLLGTNGGGFFNANSAYPVRESHRWDEPRAVHSHVVDSVQPASHLRDDGRQPPARGCHRRDMAVLFTGAQVAMYLVESAHSGTALQLADAAMEGDGWNAGRGEHPGAG